MIKIPDQVKRILETLESAGYEAWCVGGAVRDLLLGREPSDWDVTTNALPETVLELFSPHALPTGLQHGTVTVGGGCGAVYGETTPPQGAPSEIAKCDFPQPRLPSCTN